MALANPIMLVIGGLLLGIPIVLHFLMQRKPKHIVFPALRFVRQRQSANQRQLRLRHLLLLALRCAVIFVLAAAFAGLSAATNLAGAWLTIGGLALVLLVTAILLAAALILVRPINWWLIGILGAVSVGLLIATSLLSARAISQGKDVVISNEREPVAAVLLFDTGPQMSYRFENQTRLEKAQEIGQWVIEQLPAESEVSICDSSSTEPVFSVDISAASKRMRALSQTYLPQPIAQQLEKCFRLVNSSERVQHEIYVFTDLSIAAWRESNVNTLRRLLEQDSSTHLYVIDVSVEAPANFLLGEVEVDTQSIGVQAAATIRTRLERLGDAGRRIVQVKIEKQDPRLPVRRDRKTIAPESEVVNSAEFDVAENGQTPIELPISELSAGLHHGSVEILGADGIPMDDQRFFSLEVRDRWPVLVVAPKDVYIKDVAELLERNRAISLALTTAVQGDFSNLKLQDFNAVFLLDPAPLTEAQWSDLNRYVNDGGSLAVFLGDNAAASATSAAVGGTIDASFQSEVARLLLPGRLTDVWRVDEDPVYLNPTEFNHPILRPMQGYATSIPWTDFPIKRFWGFDVEEIEQDEATEIVLRLNNGRPAVIAKQVGDGRVVVMTTPVTEPFKPPQRTRWNDLMVGGECWPTWWLVRNISEYLLLNEKERLNYLLGETAVLKNDPQRFPNQYQMFPPENEEPQRLVAQNNLLIYRFVNKPGVYRLKGQGEEAVNRGFSANLHPDASGLTKISNEQLDGILGEGRYELSREKAEIKRKQGRARQGRDFYPVLIMMLALFFGLEQIMANWFYKTK